MTIEPIYEGDFAPFAKAFIAAQKATEAVKKAAANPAFKSKYADLCEVVEAVVPALNANGIGVMQFPANRDGKVYVTTVFFHESGSRVTGVLELTPSKTDPQGVGSAITYGRRYSLLAMTGAAPEDDDGHAASGPKQEAPPKAWEPSGPARVAVNTLESYQRDPDAFKEFWNLNKEGLRNVLDAQDYAWVVAGMKRVAASMKAEDPKPAITNGRGEARATPQRQSVADLIGEDEIPY